MWSNDQQEQNTTSHCSFCGTRQDQVNQLTKGPGGTAICDECVDLSRNHLEAMAETPNATTKLMRVCTHCGTRSPASHHYCFNCGAHYPQEA